MLSMITFPYCMYAHLYMYEHLHAHTSSYVRTPAHTHTHTHLYGTQPSHTHTHTDSGEYSTVEEANALLGKSIQVKEVILEDKIGEGQFGDVHKGVLYPDVSVCAAHPLVQYTAIQFIQ